MVVGVGNRTGYCAQCAVSFYRLLFGDTFAIAPLAGIGCSTLSPSYSASCPTEHRRAARSYFRRFKNTQFYFNTVNLLKCGIKIKQLSLFYLRICVSNYSILVMYCYHVFRSKYFLVDI